MDLIIRCSQLVDSVHRRLMPSPEITVKNGVIVDIKFGVDGEKRSQKFENTSKIVELGNCFLLPGLIDCHTHLTYWMGDNYLSGFVHETAADFALRGASNAIKTLDSGVTTVRDVGSVYFTDIALSKSIKNGSLIGPDIIPCGHILSVPGGNGDITGFAPGILERDYKAGIVSRPSDAIAAVRYQIKHGAKWIKVAASGGVVSHDSSAHNIHLSPAEIRSIVEEADRHDVKVAAHAHSASSIKACIDAGVGSIEHGTFADDEALESLYKSGTPLVPTTSVLDELDPDKLSEAISVKAKDAIARGREGLREAIKSGINIVFGSDAGIVPHGENTKELEALSKLGMEPYEIISAATTKASEMLEISDCGSIQLGMKADLIATQFDPVKQISELSNPIFVCKSGTIVKNDLGMVA